MCYFFIIHRQFYHNKNILNILYISIECGIKNYIKNLLLFHYPCPKNVQIDFQFQNFKKKFMVTTFFTKK